MWNDYPQLLAVAAVWAYWSSVLAMVWRSHRRYGTAAGAVPQTGKERVMWLLWVPAIVLWQVVPTWANISPFSFFAAPAVLTESAWAQPIRWTAVAFAWGAYLATARCWFFMGANWSMAVVPKKGTDLITGGAFSRVRHPIYTLSLGLMATTLVVAPSPATAVLALIHWGMLTMKTVSEEKYLVQVHGEQYEDYQQRSGRFLPKLWVPEETVENKRKAA